MAVYGVNTSTGAANGGVIPFTGWSSTLGAGSANSGSTSGAVQFNGQTQEDYPVANSLQRGANRAALAILKAAIGAAAGTAIGDVNYKRVQAQVPGGGLMPIETVSVVNRNTTAADLTALTALLSRSVAPSTYVADLSGNGGGGKLSYQGIS